MKDFKDFEKVMSADGEDVYREVIEKTNSVANRQSTEDKRENEAFFIHTLSVTSAMTILKKYHEWLNKE